MTDANVSVSFSASVADFVAGVGQAKDALQSFSAPFGDINGQLASLAKASADAFSAARFQPYRDALTATQSLEQSLAADRARAAAAMRAGDDEAYADATRAAQLAATEELRLIEDGLKQKLALYGEEARAYAISQSQKLALSTQAINEAYALEVGALKEREALGEQSLAAKQRVDDLFIEATRRRDDEMTSVTRAALQEQERDYQSFANAIEQAFNSQLRGLISGTENWHTAFKNVLEGLLIKFIEMTETTVANHLLGETMKTAATTTGVAARTGAEEAGAAASMGAQGAAMVRSILSSAAESFAGVFGFLAPLMGPFAAGPAAAAQATVAGMAGSVASADIGMWQAPQDMLTLVHHNELIMPAAEAGAFRSMLGDGAAGGGNPGAVQIHPTTNVHVSALDAGSVSQWMKSNSGTMMKAIDEAMKHGAHLGLKGLGGPDMVTATGVHLLPSTGEFTYDTIPFIAAQHSWTTGTLFGAEPINTYFAPGGAKTDYSYAIDQLQAAHPECRTVSVVVSWFFNSEDAAACKIYPSTIFLLGEIWQAESGVPVETHWMVSGLTEQDFPGVIPLPTTSNGSYVYGGTPSDPSIVRCIRDLKARGFKVVFYPFLLGTCPGYPWRGRIAFSPDNSSAATAAVGAFLGAAAGGEFVQDPVNLTVGYLGSKFDWTYRRMILHYANLCCVAGGVNLFVIGSELRGLETIRGPAWTAAGTTNSSGAAVWDYPFVAGLVTLANDVRSVFDLAGLTKSLATLENLITYSADWSSWMGWQHPGANGQWPHLDSLWASSNIDLVSFDNYLPLSDWTTGTGGIDATENWSRPAPSGSWPPSSATMSGLGLSGVPTIYSSAYLKANIEGGQYYNWFYNDGNNDGIGLDPNGSGLQVSLCEGDRLAQARNAYRPINRSSPTSSYAGGGTTPITPFMRPAAAGFRKGRRPNGRRSRSRSSCSNTASRRSTRRPISRTCSSTPNRLKAPRRTGRSGTTPAASAICRSATTPSPRWPCKQSMTTGTPTETTPPAAPACRCSTGRSPASGIGTLAPGRSSRSTRRRGATPATGRRATGRRDSEPRLFRRRRPRRRHPEPSPSSRACRLSDGRC